MKRCLTALVSAACLAAVLALPTSGQDRKAESDPAATDLEGYSDELHRSMLADLNTQTNEDIEILGEVLRVALEKLYGPHGTVSVSETLGTHPRWVVNVTPGGTAVTDGHGPPNGLWFDTRPPTRNPYAFSTHFPPWMNLTEQGDSVSGVQSVKLERPEGVYLPGYGVVYQVRLDVPAPEEERPEKPQREADKARIDGLAWENAKRTLRGQPPEPLGIELDYGVPTKDDLVNELLDVLSENAARFRNLQPEDRLTVAITFPRNKVPATSAYDETTGVEVESPGARTDHPSGWERSDHASRWEALMALTDAPLVYLAGEGETRSSHEVSGDLHMRQQNYQKAIEAYRKAVEATLPLKRRRALQEKMIQAYAALGDLEKARTLIEEALASQSKSENRDAPSKPAQGIPLPARLVVTVSKSQLDDVAAGKMTREELNKHATVHYFKPPPKTPGLDSRAGRAAGRRVLLVSQEAGNKTDVQLARNATEGVPYSPIP